MTETTDHYYRINEIKNWVYCPRIPYYTLCLRLDRGTDHSRLGIEAETDTKIKMRRRKHALHAVLDGKRCFDVLVVSHELKIVGRIDEIVETDTGVYIVDYKDTDKDYGYWGIQLLAYQLALQEMRPEIPIGGSYVYTIPTKKYHPVRTNGKHRQQLMQFLTGLKQILVDEQFPPPTLHHGKCSSCQYNRFCNDVN